MEYDHKVVAVEVDMWVIQAQKETTTTAHHQEAVQEEHEDANEAEAEEDGTQEELEDASEAAAEEDGNEVDDNATLTRLQHTSHVVLRAQEQEQEQADSDDSDGEKQDFKVGMQVYLNISKSRIAKGKVVKELNHGSVVGDRKLGRDWCEVSIEIAIRRTEELLRKHSGLKTIEDAIGSAVVWPCSLIYPVVPEFDEEDDG